MKAVSSTDFLQNFGQHLIDVLSNGPMTIERHGKPYVVIMSYQDWLKLTGGSTGDFDAQK